MIKVCLHIPDDYKTTLDDTFFNTYIQPLSEVFNSTYGASLQLMNRTLNGIYDLIQTGQTTDIKTLAYESASEYVNNMMNNSFGIISSETGVTYEDYLASKEAVFYFFKTVVDYSVSFLNYIKNSSLANRLGEFKQMIIDMWAFIIGSITDLYNGITTYFGSDGEFLKLVDKTIDFMLDIGHRAIHAIPIVLNDALYIMTKIINLVSPIVTYMLWRYRPGDRRTRVAKYKGFALMALFNLVALPLLNTIREFVDIVVQKGAIEPINLEELSKKVSADLFVETGYGMAVQGIVIVYIALINFVLLLVQNVYNVRIENLYDLMYVVGKPIVDIAKLIGINTSELAVAKDLFAIFKELSKRMKKDDIEYVPDITEELTEFDVGMAKMCQSAYESPHNREIIMVAKIDGNLVRFVYKEIKSSSLVAYYESDYYAVIAVRGSVSVSDLTGMTSVRFFNLLSNELYQDMRTIQSHIDLTLQTMKNVILVGHSRGAYVISNAMTKYSDDTISRFKITLFALPYAVNAVRHIDRIAGLKSVKKLTFMQDWISNAIVNYDKRKNVTIFTNPEFTLLEAHSIATYTDVAINRYHMFTSDSDELRLKYDQEDNEYDVEDANEGPINETELDNI